eukprot:3217772-Pyramimonas_sp.AAC.1
MCIRDRQEVHAMATAGAQAQATGQAGAEEGKDPPIPGQAPTWVAGTKGHSSLGLPQGAPTSYAAPLPPHLRRHHAAVKAIRRQVRRRGAP